VRILVVFCQWTKSRFEPPVVSVYSSEGRHLFGEMIPEGVKHLVIGRTFLESGDVDRLLRVMNGC
jgi:hypothetical protein